MHTTMTHCAVARGVWCAAVMVCGGVPWCLLLQLIVYDYAVVGLWWFGGMLEHVEAYSIPEANFSASC